MEELLKFLNSIHPLSEPLQEYLVQTLKLKELPAEGFLLKEGWVCDKICFIQKGLFRCYYFKNEEEVCSWFMTEGDVIISVFSFFDQIPSYEYIQALEPSAVLYITYQEYDYIKRKFSEFNVVRAVLLEHYYKLSEQRLYALRKQTALERLQHLFEKQYSLMVRVPDKYLATYLDMTPSTFSRNKSRYFQNQAR
jgi:CRP-like cAMP-binding protein